MEYMTIQDKQMASLDALLNFDKYSSNNNIRYFLAYGSLIGAVRHKGFIPWDDDVDVHIPRPDYEKILSEYQDPTGNFKLVSCFNTKDYFLPYAKIQNMNTARVLEGGVLDHHGIGIDLFPLDGISGDLAKAERNFLKQNNTWLKVANRLDMFRMLQASSFKEHIKYLLGCAAYRSGYLSRESKKLSKSPLKYGYEDSEKVGTLVGIHSGRFRPFEKEWFAPCKLEFEGYSLSAPSGFHEILTMIYGNYMELPPEEKRVTTHTDKFVWIK